MSFNNFANFLVVVVIILISVFRIADINPETPPEIKFSPTCFIISLSRFLILFILSITLFFRSFIQAFKEL